TWTTRKIYKIKIKNGTKNYSDLLLVQVCMNLVDIMPRRQQAVIEVKGGPTKY
uniref:Uncharacterized protein n=1 Tax=Cyprinus carpio TaxID=7962 RepID=A0A8C2G9R9_CYPCA